MDSKTKEEIENIITKGSIRLIEDYTNSALLINACHVSLDRYKNIQKPIHLSTTANIPESLRLDHEIEVSLENKDLIEKYSNDAQKLIYENYITNSVSILDAVFEDIYEKTLNYHEPDLTPKQVSDRIRSAWSNDNLITYIVNKTEIQDSANPNKRIKEAFDRYKEYRIIRHALMHNKGNLSNKHIQQLDEIYNSSDNISKQKSLKNSPFYNDRVINLNINIVLAIRKFLYELLIYFSKAMEYIKIDN